MCGPCGRGLSFGRIKFYLLFLLVLLLLLAREGKDGMVWLKEQFKPNPARMSGENTLVRDPLLQRTCTICL